MKHLHGSDDRNTIGTIRFYPFLVSAKLHIKWKVINTQRRTRGTQARFKFRKHRDHLCLFFSTHRMATLTFKKYIYIYFLQLFLCNLWGSAVPKKVPHGFIFYSFFIDSVFLSASYTAVTVLFSHSSHLLVISPIFSCTFHDGDPPTLRLWSRGLQRKLCTDPLLLCSPFAPSWSSSPLFFHQ